jgi:GDSL/SGNH-like Acyl-Esterase family found in Pmr5 and Cas1p
MNSCSNRCNNWLLTCFLSIFRLNYYQEGDKVHPQMSPEEAYKKALITWARWVDANIDPNRTRVLFRGYSWTHYR